jgi:hypothetical protein
MSLQKIINNKIEETIIYKKDNKIVKLFDNFFSDIILDKILDFLKKKKWNSIEQKYNKNLNTDYPFWNIQISCDFFKIYLKNIIESILDKKFDLIRVYAVGQSYGQDSNFHIDDDRDDTYTFCFYINDTKMINEDGLFYLKLGKERHIITIEPNINRAILFPSTYRHKGSNFNRFNNNFRICIAWKFKLL